jgi:DNA-binding CsgD family transcriptional regulator
VPLQAPAGDVRIFAIGRPSGSYRDAELTLARQVQRVLVGMDDQLRAYRRWRDSLRRFDRFVDPDAPASEYRLTPREITALSLLADAPPAKLIAQRLCISPRTVDKHVENLYRKLGASDRVSAILRAQAAGLLASPPSHPEPGCFISTPAATCGCRRCRRPRGLLSPTNEVSGRS